MKNQGGIFLFKSSALRLSFILYNAHIDSILKFFYQKASRPSSWEDTACSHYT
ncbi:MAG: hypothetical protein ABF249_07785 [Flavobacteriales bacterium]